jgi:F-type H+-transporting ATPase subunit delta
MSRIESYAQALFNVAQSEGNLAEVEDELFRFGRALDGHDELRTTLTDAQIPAARRQQVVEDLLGGKATDTTVSLISMVVGAGRARDLPKIIDELVEMSAAESNKVVAEVRSAIDLSADQRDRLATALNAATGKTVELKVIVDPSVMGGIVTQIGDTVIDGTVRSRLTQLRDVF